MNLSEREKLILEALVELHVRDAAPVSSSAIQHQLGVDLSSASIRNVLHGLEEKGLLQQPHTSAGRVPTSDGYRLYVDLFLRPAQLPIAWVRHIDAELQASHDMHEILARVSKLLAGMSSNVGVGLALPAEPVPHVHRIELVALEGDNIMAAVTLDNGVVRTEMLRLGHSVLQPSLTAAEHMLREIVVDRTPAAARQHLDRTLEYRIGEGSDVVRDVARQKDRVFADWPQPALHVQGASEIMVQPEFTDPQTLRLLVRLLDHPENLEALLIEQGRAQETSITIGEESRRFDLSPFSLVVAGCTIAGRPSFVGILGPMRMRYSLAMALVGRVADAVRSLDGPAA
jgi:heat-inducible transcriptional repressor